MLQYIVLWSLFSNVCKEKDEKKKRRKEDKGGEKGEKEMVQLPSPALWFCSKTHFSFSMQLDSA